jgi:hypothetical protein
MAMQWRPRQRFRIETDAGGDDGPAGDYDRLGGVGILGGWRWMG